MRIAIVEDDEREGQELAALLERWGQEASVTLQVERFSRPLLFLDRYTDRFDVVFMDIDMEGCDGLEAAAQVRERDDAVVIVFVTRMAQLAIRGYEVNAIDFVVKPATYERVARLMARVVRATATRPRAVLSIRSQSGVVRVSVQDLAYVEVYRHRLLYHMADGTTHESYGSLAQVEGELPPGLFMRCNSCYLVNLRLVRAVKGDMVLVGGDALRVSRARKREFVDALVSLVGE